MSDVSIFKERVWPVLFMFIVTVVFITLVSGIQLATKDTVERNATLFLKKAVLYAAGIELPSVNEEIQDLYDARVREETRPDGSIIYYRIVDASGNPTGYAVSVSGTGLWGAIDSVIGYSEDLTRLTGIDFTDQNETPGLGGRIVEDWYRDQFRGKTPPLRYDADGEERTAVGPGQVDAVTGATYSSAGVLDMVNSVSERISSIIAQGR